MKEKISKIGIKVGNLLVAILNFTIGLILAAYLLHNSKIEQGYIVISIVVLVFLFTIFINDKMEKEMIEKNGERND